VARDADHAPFRDSGMTCIQHARTATINLQTKLEVSNYTDYEDMKSGAKCTNWDSSRVIFGGSVTICFLPFFFIDLST